MPGVEPTFRTLEYRNTNAFKLVPGGRWLLIGDFDGLVSYYDLDCRDLKPIPLIAPEGADRGACQDVDALDIYVDPEAPVLQFKVVVTGLGESNNYVSAFPTSYSRVHHPPLAYSTPRRLCVWQVKLNDDDSLVAEWVTSVPVPSYRSRSGLDTLVLEQHRLVRAVIRGDLSSVEVYWWRHCSPTHVLRAAFTIPGAPVRQLAHLVYFGA